MAYFPEDRPPESAAERGPVQPRLESRRVHLARHRRLAHGEAAHAGGFHLVGRLGALGVDAGMILGQTEPKLMFWDDNTGRKELRICFCFGSLVRQVMWRLRIALPWKHSTAAEMQSANCQFCCSQLFP